MNQPRHPGKRTSSEDSSFTVQQAGLMTVIFLALALTLQAAAPAWWTATGGPLNSNPANNSLVVSQGQLKQFTQKAVRYMDTNLPDGAGSTLDGLLVGWSNYYATNGYSATNRAPSDDKAATQGQLKYIASLVYGQLANEGYTGLYPSWLNTTTNNDHAVASAGQLKTVFNFDLAAAPPAVTGLTASNDNPGEIDLSWTLPALNNATSIILQRSTNGGTTWTTFNTISYPTETSIADLSPPSGGALYRVTLANSAGSSTPTATVIAVTPQPSAPPVPESLTGSVNLSGTMILSWTASDGATGYKIERETIATGTWTELTTTTSTATTYNDAGHGAGGYRYRVSAVTTTGTYTTPSPPTGVFPQPRYITIDLGTNAIPTKVTNSGYVLLNGSGSYDATSTTASVWSNGTPHPLQLTGSYTALGVHDITEDGTSVGMEMQVSTTNSPPGVYLWDHGTTMTYAQTSWTGTGTVSGSPTVLPDNDLWQADGTLPTDPVTFTYELRNINVGLAIDPSHQVWSYRNQPPPGGPVINPVTVTTDLPHYYLYILDDWAGSTEMGTPIAQSPVSGIHPLHQGPVVSVIAVNNQSQVLKEIDTYNSTGTATITHQLDSTTLSFDPYGLSNRATTATGTTTYVIGTQTTTSGTITTTSPVWWDGTTVHTLTDGSPVAINAAILTTTVSGTSVIQPATQMVGLNNAGGILWQMSPTGTFGGALSLNDLLPEKSGYSGLRPTGRAINDSGCIVCTGTFTTVSGTTTNHAVMLVPASFQLRDIANIAKGWDPPSSSSDGNAWTVVATPTGTTSHTNNLVKLVLPPNAQDLGLECVVVDTDVGYSTTCISIPSITLTGTDTNIDITGIVPTGSVIKDDPYFDIHGRISTVYPTPAHIVLRQKTTPKQVFLTLNVIVLRPRTVTVDIDYIDDSANSASVISTTTPSTTDIIDILNETFKDQANITFSLHATHHITATGDFNGSGELELHLSAKTPLSKQPKIGNVIDRAIAGVPAGTITICIVKHLHDLDGSGLDGVTERMCTLVNANASILDFAHEIGHVLGLSSKWEGQAYFHDLGPWPTEFKVIGYSHPQGLMYPYESSTIWIRSEDWNQANDQAIQIQP